MAMDPRRVALLTFIESEFFDSTRDVLLYKSAFNQKKKDFWIFLDFEDRNRHARIPLYAETWVTQYSEVNFYRLFRMVPETFETLLSVISTKYEPKLQRGDNLLVDARKALLMCIFYLAHKDSYIQIADRFNVAESTAVYEIEYILFILVELRSTYIVWPREVDCPAIAQQFQERGGIPDVIGAIDGSHVNVSPPKDQQMSYINRKLSHSILLQAVCTASKLFTDIVVGVPGRRHDVAVLRVSELYQDCKTYGTHTRFYNNFHILGDSAYPCLSWLISPYKKPPHGDLDGSQMRFNYRHSSTRTVIENAFALLKGRWSRLKYVYVKDIGKVSDIIVAACVLHNFCLINDNEEWTDMYYEVNRQIMHCQVIDADYDAVEALAGHAKRDTIKRIVS